MVFVSPWARQRKKLIERRKRVRGTEANKRVKLWRDDELHRKNRKCDPNFCCWLEVIHIKSWWSSQHDLGFIDRSVMVLTLLRQQSKGAPWSKTNKTFNLYRCTCDCSSVVALILFGSSPRQVRRQWAMVDDRHGLSSRICLFGGMEFNDLYFQSD